MVNKKDFLIPLEKFDTKDVKDGHINGSLTVIWRNWDKILKNEPKMVYVSSVNPGEIKGPHLHKKRNSYFICIHGKVRFVIKEKSGKYNELDVNSDFPTIVFVPNNIASAHYNLSKTVSRILVLADIAWRPNDNEMENLIFSDYKFKK